MKMHEGVMVERTGNGGIGLKVKVMEFGTVREEFWHWLRGC